IVGGLTKHRVNDVLDVALERFREYRAVFEELKSTKNQLVDRKKIERAKGLLMSRDNLSEENAYHALRHLAMERNQRIVDIANKILENL
ncbi:MAG: ANTAR domain-containing protein, partial [Gammaproteobacteria bacterium]|nr:ANTAR domain-containing protein [Gammaproteobacteria bacterium]